MKQKHSNKKFQKFEAFFLEKKQALLNPTIRDAVQIDGGDEVDIVQTMILTDMAQKLSLRDQSSLRKINEALQRLKEGTFGICDECEKDISEKRLEAAPDCNTCIICAERQEKVARQYRR